MYVLRSCRPWNPRRSRLLPLLRLLVSSTLFVQKSARLTSHLIGSLHHSLVGSLPAPLPPDVCGGSGYRRRGAPTSPAGAPASSSGPQKTASMIHNVPLFPGSLPPPKGRQPALLPCCITRMCPACHLSLSLRLSLPLSLFRWDVKLM